MALTNLKLCYLLVVVLIQGIGETRENTTDLTPSPQGKLNVSWSINVQLL